jgi:hypothetical protein
MATATQNAAGEARKKSKSEHPTYKYMVAGAIMNIQVGPRLHARRADDLGQTHHAATTRGQLRPSLGTRAVIAAQEAPGHQYRA